MSVQTVLFLSLCLLLFALGGCDETSKEPAVIRDFLAASRAKDIISKQQLASLISFLESYQQTANLEIAMPNGTVKEPSVFWRVVSHFTLRNVLYFSGALLVMGAYTLFMTLAFEKFRYSGLSVVLGLQLAIFSGIGIKLWYSDELQLVGGL